MHIGLLFHEQLSPENEIICYGNVANMFANILIATKFGISDTSITIGIRDELNLWKICKLKVIPINY